LLEEIRRFRVQDPEVQALRGEAAAALDADPPDQDLARAKLEAARDLVRRKRQAAVKLLADQQREEAQLVREQAGIEESRLRLAEAARLYEEAASLLPADDSAQRWSDLIDAGLRWTDQGRDFGDNEALLEAIRVYLTARGERSREEAPLDWAMTQDNLGNALWALGQRGSGTARLDEAVTAYRAALEERTREHVPLDWAKTQNNLGTALWALGQRTRDLDQLTAARTAIGNAHALVTQAGYEQYAAYFQDRLESLERTIAVVKAGLAKAP
jgi:tetratricopeptide (TPR) repeat protein